MPTIETEISDEEPRTDADIVLVIKYDETKGSAARAFEIAASLIHSLEAMDEVFCQTIDANLDTALIVEDLSKSSLKIFLKNVIKELPDEALKDASVKKFLGHFLVKAKYAAIKWLDSPDDGRRSLPDLTETIALLAKESDIRHLPDYPAPNSARLAQVLDGFQEAKSKFTDKESLTITLGREDYIVDTKSVWLPSERTSGPTENKLLSNEQDLFLVISKPILIGDAKWEFKHGKRSIKCKIEDEKWLAEFRGRKHALKPGDALRVHMRSDSKYDASGNLISTEDVVTKVFEVIPGPEEPDDLFD
jgi:hypothetical protein